MKSVLWLLCFVCVVSTQECTTFQGSPAACEGRTTYPVFVGKNQSYDELARLAGDETILQALAPSGCRFTAFSFSCAKWFQKCHNFTLANRTVVSVGRPLCRHMCVSLNTDCEQTFRIAGRAPVNCTEVIDGVETYPVSNRTIKIDGQTFRLPCFGYRDNDTSSIVDNVVCPYPLVFQEASKTDPTLLPCNVGCLDPMFTPAEYRIGRIESGIVGLVALLCTIWLCSTLIMMGDKIAFPRNLPLIMLIEVCLLTFVMVVPVLNGLENLLCDGTQYAKHGACVFQGTVFLYLSMSLITWWGLISFNLFYFVVIRKKELDPKSTTSKRLKIVYSVFGWGIPVILTVIPLSFGKIGASNAITWCFLLRDDNGIWQLIFFFIPMWTITFCGAVFVISTIVQIVYTSVVIKKYATNKANITLILFLLGYLFTLLYVSGFHFDSERKIKVIEAGYRQWIECLIDPFKDPNKKCTFESRLDVNSWYFQQITPYVGAILMVLSFGFANLQVLGWWRDRISYVKQGKNFFTVNGSTNQLSNEKRSHNSSSFHSGRSSYDRSDAERSDLEMDSVEEKNNSVAEGPIRTSIDLPAPKVDTPDARSETMEEVLTPQISLNKIEVEGVVTEEGELRTSSIWKRAEPPKDDGEDDSKKMDENGTGQSV
eukprot:TRINITY_DN4020_c0_g1_i1.p1 TRINITY_DN4020_c0_g1~~TRINITY_DN4020_c0_g1_i1.p1  ORF type:complete len:654 (-),score=125.18 TRINITY_DN4020_c0_g1_i1:47-2008(-)